MLERWSPMCSKVWIWGCNAWKRSARPKHSLLQLSFNYARPMQLFMQFLRCKIMWLHQKFTPTDSHAFSNACSPTLHLRGTPRQRAFMNLLTVQLYYPRANMPSSSSELAHNHSISPSTLFGSDCNASFQDMPRCFSRCVPFLVFPCGGLCVLGLGFLMFSCCAQLSQNWWKLLVPCFAPCFVVRVLWNAVEMARYLYLCLLASGYITYLYLLHLSSLSLGNKVIYVAWQIWTDWVLYWLGTARCKSVCGAHVARGCAGNFCDLSERVCLLCLWHSMAYEV